MSLFTKYLGFDKKIEEIEEKHKKELVQLENAYLGEMAGLKESLRSELAAEVEGWYGLGKTERELEDIDRKTLLDQCWNAFCKSPLCRAIVKYTTIFVFGKGITYEIDNPEAKAFVDKFYQDTLPGIRTKFYYFRSPRHAQNMKQTLHFVGDI